MKKLHIITGAINSGKSTLLQRRIRSYRERGLEVDGIVAEAILDEGVKSAYYLRRIDGGERLLLAERRGRSTTSEEAAGEAPRTRGFIFHRESFARAAEWLLEAARRGVDLICIDEIGHVELRGGGHWPAFEELLKRYGGTVMLVVREELLEEFLRSCSDWDVETEVEEPELR